MGSHWSMKQELLVLTALGQGATHGYEIVKYIERTTNGFFSMSFGSLYPILHRFEKEGLVQAQWEESSTGKNKKIYKLTRAGKVKLLREKSSLTNYIDALSRLAEL